MTTDITELVPAMKAAAEKYRLTLEAHRNNPRDYDSVAAWDEATSEFMELVDSDELNIISGLVEVLEKAQQHIARQEQIILNQDESLSIRRSELEAAQQERENWRTSFDNERFRADKLKAHIDQMEPIRAEAEKLVRCKGRYHSEQNYRALAALFGVKTPDLPPLDSESRTVKLPKLKMLEDYLEEVAIEERKQILVGVKLEFHRACVAAGIKVEVE